VRTESPEPAIHGPRIVGATPGRSFLFKIPATGEGPLHYIARDLPEGLVLDAETGIVSGALAGPGETDVEIEVTGPRGKALRGLKIVAGEHRLALTPPMGWNSWYACGVGVNAEMIRHAADAMVESGLAAHGYQYICVDDCWGDRRNEDGTVKLVPKKFQDMKALGDDIHGLGLKFGIYSSPGPKTCAGYEGSLGHELQDAETFADWGVDYLKYDWCSYESVARDHTRPELEQPYRVMRQALDAVDRDIVYSICQYGMGDVWEWGADVGANLWRTGGDIAALGEASSWAGAMAIGFSHDGRERFAGPGHWNDPDMLTIAGQTEREALDMNLTPNEQIAHFTLWALLAAPLIVSCDPAQLDPFTKAVLTNDEIIAIDQDPMGKAAHRVSRTAWGQVWARPLSDKTWVVGLFNTGPRRTRLHVDWADLDLRGAQPVRNLWLHKDVGRVRKLYEIDVPPHGVVAIKVGKPILPPERRSRSR
jgi:alpha-galactosidase